jgi:hypothetical protein
MICVRIEKTAGPSTPLRSGRDDKVGVAFLGNRTNLVTPTGANSTVDALPKAENER